MMKSPRSDDMDVQNTLDEIREELEHLLHPPLKTKSYDEQVHGIYAEYNREGWKRIDKVNCCPQVIDRRPKEHHCRNNLR